MLLSSCDLHLNKINIRFLFYHKISLKKYLLVLTVSAIHLLSNCSFTTWEPWITNCFNHLKGCFNVRKMKYFLFFANKADANNCSKKRFSILKKKTFSIHWNWMQLSHTSLLMSHIFHYNWIIYQILSIKAKELKYVY